MQDEIRQTLAAYARLLDSPPPALTKNDRQALQAFQLRTGRPSPTVLFLGRRAGLFAAASSAMGVLATCSDPAPAPLRAMAAVAPSSHFVCAEIRSLPFALSSFDGVWSETVLCRIPHEQLDLGAGRLRDALRPGGLLQVRLKLGRGEERQETPGGPVWCARYGVEEFASALAMFDFGLLEQRPCDEDEAVLLFRREY